MANAPEIVYLTVGEYRQCTFNFSYEPEMINGDTLQTVLSTSIGNPTYATPGGTVILTGGYAGVNITALAPGTTYCNTSIQTAAGSILEGCGVLVIEACGG